MRIKPATLADYKIMANIHAMAFDDFFLSSLGIEFLRTIYKTSLKSSETVAFCAENEEQEIVGFIKGCTHSKGFHKRLFINNFFEFLYHGMILIFTKPKSILRLAKNLDKNKNALDDGNYAELLSIAVLPTNKGQGVGKALVKVFEEEIKKRGCKKISLTTDYTDNQDVLSFYKNTGYEVFYEFTTYPDRKMYKLIKNISD